MCQCVSAEKRKAKDASLSRESLNQIEDSRRTKKRFQGDDIKKRRKTDGTSEAEEGDDENTGG